MKKLKMAMKKNQLVLLITVICALVASKSASAQRNDGDDDFDDSGFDDSSYNSPQTHEAEGSNQNPSNYSPANEDDLDDDDDVDETHLNPQVAPDSTGQRDQGHHQTQQQAYLGNVASQGFYAPTGSLLLANINPSSASSYKQQLRHKRSILSQTSKLERGNDVEDAVLDAPLARRKRHTKYIVPVYTHVKTDKHAHYKWGAKHKVGEHRIGKYHG